MSELECPLCDRPRAFWCADCPRCASWYKRSQEIKNGLVTARSRGGGIAGPKRRVDCATIRRFIGFGWSGVRVAMHFNISEATVSAARNELLRRKA